MSKETDDLAKAWNDFIMSLAKSLKLDVFAGWLNNKLLKIKWLN